jgi:hypothetical protein
MFDAYVSTASEEGHDEWYPALVAIGNALAASRSPVKGELLPGAAPAALGHRRELRRCVG